MTNKPVIWLLRDLTRPDIGLYTMSVERQDAGRARWSDLGLILLFQVAVEVTYFLLGVRMDIFPLLGYWQILDPKLLQHDLWRSVLYLHIQPPGFNILVGIVLKLFPDLYPLAFQAFYFACGVLALWALFDLQLRFGIRRRIAMALVMLFGASPAYVLYQHHLFYTFLDASWWFISAWLLVRYLDSKRPVYCVLLYLVLWWLAWTRALVHFLYVGLVVGVLLWKVRPVGWKRWVATGLLLVAVVAPYVKNKIIFGHFTVSTWFPGNIAKITTFPIPVKDRVALHKAGRISKYSMEIFYPDPDDPKNAVIDSRGDPYWSSPGFLKRFKHLPRLPVLFSKLKSTVGPNGQNYPNINYVAMIGTYDLVLKDDIYLALHYPHVVLLSWFFSFLNYFKAAEYQDYISKDNFRAVQPVLRAYDILYARIPAPFLDRLAAFLKEKMDYNPYSRPTHLYLTLLFGFPLLLVFGLRRARHTTNASERLGLYYVTLTIIYVMLIGNLLDCGENNRIRFQTDFMYVFLAGLFVDWAAVRLRGILSAHRHKAAK